MATTTHSPRPLAGVTPDPLTASPARSQWWHSWQRFKRYRPGVVALGFIILLVLLAIFAPLVAPYNPNAVETSLRGAAPSGEHWLGNDDIGRDILSRIIYGTRVALIVGIGAMSIAVTIGVLIGATAGFFGG